MKIFLKFVIYYSFLLFGIIIHTVEGKIPEKDARITTQTYENEDGGYRVAPGVFAGGGDQGLESVDISDVLSLKGGAKTMVNAIAELFSKKMAVKGEITVYRVFGGDSRAQGFSWTTKNPISTKDFRNLAGLPSGGASGSLNTADFMIKGKVNINNIMKSRVALPLDGNVGGLPELIIDPKNVRIIDFKVLKP